MSENCSDNLWLIVPRADFRKAIQSIRRHEKNRKVETLLWVEDSMLHIHCGGVEIRLSSRGNWQGQVRVPGQVFRSILIGKGPEDIRLEFTQPDLHIEGLYLACVWQKEPSAITIPLNATTYDILQKLHRYSPSQIDECGHRETLQKAQEEADRLIKHAATILKVLRITEADLFALLEERLKHVARP